MEWETVQALGRGGEGRGEDVAQASKRIVCSCVWNRRLAAVPARLPASSGRMQLDTCKLQHSPGSNTPPQAPAGARLPSSRNASLRGRSSTRATSGSASTRRRGALKSGSPSALHSMGGGAEGGKKEEQGGHGSEQGDACSGWRERKAAVMPSPADAENTGSKGARCRGSKPDASLVSARLMCVHARGSHRVGLQHTQTTP